MCCQSCNLRLDFISSFRAGDGAPSCGNYVMWLYYFMIKFFGDKVLIFSGRFRLAGGIIAGPFRPEGR
jgi:hypothetical protein